MSVRNLDYLFRPTSIALIGASRRPRSVGAVLARNLINGGFEGPILPVNPRERAIQGVLVYSNIDSLPLTPDLAVIATPPPTIPGVIETLGKRGTKAAVVISAGFAELGDEGRRLQQQVLDAARPHLMRIVGPNCLGVMVPALGLDASFAHSPAKSGDLAFVSQSGAVLSSLIDWAKARDIGFSHLVSLGGMADVDFGDMLDYLLADARTRAILLYVEAVTHARKFMSAARAASRTKLVIVIKAGRTSAAAKAASSHTGALAGEDAVYDAAFKRAGMLRVDDLAELFAAVETLGMGLRANGNRLGIVSNGGGIGVLATDQLDRAGATLATLADETVNGLDKDLPATWSRANPIDIIGDAGPERYQAAVSAVANDANVDALLVINCPTAIADSDEAAAAVVRAAEDLGPARFRKPILTNWLGAEAAAAARQRFARARIPTFETPGAAIDGFSHLVAFHRNQQLLLQLPDRGGESIKVDPIAARSVLERALEERRDWLSEPEAKAVLDAYGIPTVHTRAAEPTPAAAAAAAASLNGPYALKVIANEIVHKSDVGGVELGLESPDAVAAAAERMLSNIANARPDANIRGLSVQEMAQMPDSVELILGVKSDALFGPVLLFGAGGIAVDITADRSLVLPPLNREIARQAMTETRVWRLLQGYRHVAGADINAIADTLVRLGDLVADQDLIDELDINPLLANAHGVLALDARVRVKTPERRGVARLAIKPYPRELEKTVTLSDGTLVHIRPIRPEDAGMLQDMIAQSRMEDIRLRFFAAMKTLPPKLAARLTQIDYDREMAFVATPVDKPDDGLWGAVRLAADPDFEAAEYAVIARSDVIGHGLGWTLMREIIAYARQRGIGELFGEVLSENQRMRAMCKELGFIEHQGEDREAVHVTLDLR